MQRRFSAALLAMVLVGVVAELYASSSPQAATDSVAPSAPTNLRITATSETTFTLEWNASSDNVKVEGYGVLIGKGQPVWTPITKYTVSGLTCGMSYTVELRAFDHARNLSKPVLAVVATKPCLDVQPPSAPSGLQQIARGTTTVTLSWQAATDNVAVGGYELRVGGASVGKTSESSYGFDGLSCGSTYSIGVRAYDVSGNYSAWTSYYATTSPCSVPPPPPPPPPNKDTVAPSVPQNLVLLSRTSTSVTVSWAPSTDNVGVARYGAYRDGALVGSTVERTYTFTGLACGTGRTFGVDAVDAAGNRSGRANVVLQTAACGDFQSPSTPTKLAVSGTTTNSLTLGWQASSDNVGVVAYDVFVSGSKVATITGTSSVVGGLKCSTAYLLGVEARDAAGNRSVRATILGSTAACGSPPPPPSGSGTLYVAANGSDGGQCMQSAPCASFARAYQLARPGYVVHVAGGSYPTQTLPDDATKTSTTDVVFQPMAGASVSLAGFITGSDTTGAGAKHFELQSMRIAGELQLRRGTEDVVLRNIDGDSFNLSSARGVQVLGGDWGPKLDNVNQIKNGSQDILIDGARFHDYTISYPGKHAECVHIWAASRVTIRNSLFQNCTDFGIFAKREGGAIIDGLLFENNMLDAPMPGNAPTSGCSPACPRAGNSIRLSASGGPITNSIVRYNSVLGGIGTDGQAGIVLKANISDPLNFVDPVTTDGTMDLHLRTGAPAIGAGDPGDFPGQDRDGESRPQGGAPDAGADERI